VNEAATHSAADTMLLKAGDTDTQYRCRYWQWSV